MLMWKELPDELLRTKKKTSGDFYSVKLLLAKPGPGGGSKEKLFFLLASLLYYLDYLHFEFFIFYYGFNQALLN